MRKTLHQTDEPKQISSTKPFSKPISFQIFSTALVALGSAFFIFLSIYDSDGKLVYTLDDPYIHLAVAENILNGSFGINSGEFSSPSSSIIWPYLLAILLKLGVGELSPLAYSFPMGLASIWILSGWVWESTEKHFGGARQVAFFLLPLLLALFLNAFGLPMTGMEHSTHVFASLLLLWGLARLSEGKGDTYVIAVYVGIFLCATIRFEGLALAFLGIGGLCLLERWRDALANFTIIASALAIYAAYMNAHGLPFFPSSVLTKSELAVSASQGNLFDNLGDSISHLKPFLQNKWRMVLLFFTVYATAGFIFSNKTVRKYRIILAICAIAILAHIIGGKYGFFNRYQVYVVGISIFSFATAIRVGLRFRNGLATVAFTAIVLAYVSDRYSGSLLDIPKGAENIYQQQYQMGRFVKEYFPERLAVNDLGWVSFKNDLYVLDLWGLGSEEARKLRNNDVWKPDDLASISRRHSVVFAMIYREWIPDVPKNWEHVATLETSQITSASPFVFFYLLDLTKRKEMENALERFSETLPEGATLHMVSREANPL